MKDTNVLKEHNGSAHIKLVNISVWTLDAETASMGLFKCYVTQMGVGGGLIFWKKALRRCNVQCY